MSIVDFKVEALMKHVENISSKEYKNYMDRFFDEKVLSGGRYTITSDRNKAYSMSQARMIELIKEVECNKEQNSVYKIFVEMDYKNADFNKVLPVIAKWYVDHMEDNKRPVRCDVRKEGEDPELDNIIKLTDAGRKAVEQGRSIPR